MDQNQMSCLCHAHVHLKAAGKECNLLHSSHYMNSSLEKMINEMCLDECNGLNQTKTLLKGLQHFGRHEEQDQSSKEFKILFKDQLQQYLQEQPSRGEKPDSDEFKSWVLTRCNDFLEKQETQYQEVSNRLRKRHIKTKKLRQCLLKISMNESLCQQTSLYEMFQNDNQIELDKILNQTLHKKSILTINKRSNSANDRKAMASPKQGLLDEIKALQRQVAHLTEENIRLTKRIEQLTEPLSLNQQLQEFLNEQQSFESQLEIKQILMAKAVKNQTFKLPIQSLQPKSRCGQTITLGNEEDEGRQPNLMHIKRQIQKQDKKKSTQRFKIKRTPELMAPVITVQPVNQHMESTPKFNLQRSYSAEEFYIQGGSNSSEEEQLKQRLNSIQQVQKYLKVKKIKRH